MEAREGEELFATIQRNRSGVDSGEIDFRLKDCTDLSETDKRNLINTAYALYQAVYRQLDGQKTLALAFFAFAFLCVGVASAAPPLTITKSGYFLTVVDASGNPSLEKIATVIDLRDGGTVPDVPPVVVVPEPPPVVVDAALVAEIKAAAVAIQDPASAQGISLAYTQIRDAFGDGLVSDEAIWAVLKTATDSALVVTAGKDWKPFRSKLSAIITARKQQGTLDTKDEIVAYLTAIKAGLEQAAEGSVAIPFSDVIKITKATNEAIDDN